MIHISSTIYNGLYWMGGTGHWFHFVERIFPMLSEAREKIWGPTAVGKFDKNVMYIVFEEDEAINSLGNFL